MNRLTVVDEMFLRAHRGMGTPIALQGIWRTADRVGSELLRDVHEALRTGPLGRRVVRSRIPGARPRWQVTGWAHPLVLAGEPLAAHTLLEWADGQGADLDPEFGPGWRLSAAPLDDGGSVVALTCSHALADGRALTLAVDNALAGTPLATPAAPHSDWADARRQWSVVLGGTARALRRGIPRRPPSPPARETPSDHPDAAPRSAVLQIPARDWNRVAVAHGGTANSLFVHAVANMLWSTGFPEPEIAVSLPVDTRDEPRVDNDLAMTEIAVRRTDTPATIRHRARAAYEHRMTSPGGMPEELLQVLPDRWAHALARGAGERDILCSNIGTLPDSLLTLGPHQCTGVAARAIHPGLRADAFPRTRLSAYFTRIADTYTLGLVGLDPQRIPTAADLRDLAGTTLGRLGLTATPW
ncbi:Uncharacterised protein [Nocardia otitidiscaviarum]|uniref:Condensation domain-containing protein n=1 Tax=Nocardia otitidiscaviarum TaxID=1823 RepID=A0A378Y8B6_9NOCA|nr:hypothetical protein [Nocardia otitidiscaviarum]SUA73472.1 Uncharacterised protein [Nocardia otitidiscaviarum]